MFEIKRGEIYLADLEPVVGSEQGGERPVLVLQNNKGNEFSPTVIVAAITTKIEKKPWMPTHIQIHCERLPKESMVLLEQIRTVDKIRLKRRMGQAPEPDMKAVEKAILISFGVQYNRI